MNIFTDSILFQFKGLMHHIDPPDDDESEDGVEAGGGKPPVPTKQGDAPEEVTIIPVEKGESEQTMDTTEICSVEKENIEETPRKEEKPRSLPQPSHVSFFPFLATFSF